MHSIETREKFIDLRSQGHSLDSIAQQTGVSRRTLVDWCREYRPQIDSIRATELEDLRERTIASHSRGITHLSSLLDKIDESLAQRTLEGLYTDQLIRLALLTRREIRHACLAAQTAIEPHPAPAPAPVPASTPAPVETPTPPPQPQDSIPQPTPPSVSTEPPSTPAL